MSVPFGKYQLIASLGRGGMADVYLAGMAGPVGFRKLVVIKRIRDDVPDREAYTTMLLEEAQLAARLQHPNVVQTFEVGVHEGQHYIAMEFLEGQSVAKILQVSGRPDAAFTVRVMADALAGLEYAHSLADYDGRPLRIVHRDVSPQNLFVTYAGEVKVVDFGVAKTSQQGAGHTDVGVIKGKIGYMSPEQLNQATVDRRTDVFAAGIVFWELLTGKRLFKAANEIEAIAKVLYDPIAPPRSLVPDIPEPVEAICLRALEREPMDRWQSAGEMREALYAYMESPGGAAFRRDDVGRYLNARFEKERIDVRAQVTVFMAEAEAEGESDKKSGLESLGTIRLSGPTSGPTSLPRNETPTSPEPMGAVHSRPASMPGASVAGASMPGAATNVPSVRGPVLATGRNLVAKSMPPRRLLGPFVVLAATVFGVAFGVGPKLCSPPPSLDSDAGGEPVGMPARPAPVLVVEGSGTLGVEAVPLVLDGFFKKRGATSVRRERGAHEQDVTVIGTVNGVEEAIVVKNPGTSRAFACLAEGSCDVGMAAREIRANEAEELVAKGVGDVRSSASEHVVALDGVAVVVHPSNAVRSLDLAQLESVFTGAARDWAGVGGKAGPIAIVSHEDGTGTLDVFSSIALGGHAVAASAKRVSDNAGIADLVASDPSAIGFLGMSFVRGAKALAIGDRHVTPMFPSAFTVSTERYLLSRRMYLYSSQRPKQLARDFVDYATSEAAAQAIRQAGFTDLGVSLKNAEPCPSCPARYTAATKRARRLSLDFRFRPGTRELDARAARDVDRVVRFVREHEATKILLLGFTDGTSDAKGDRKRSRELAQAVDTELAARGVRATVVEGFGGDMQVSTSTTDAGKNKNRRVEIWLEEH